MPHIRVSPVFLQAATARSGVRSGQSRTDASSLPARRRKAESACSEPPSGSFTEPPSRFMSSNTAAAERSNETCRASGALYSAGNMRYSSPALSMRALNSPAMRRVSSAYGAETIPRARTVHSRPLPPSARTSPEKNCEEREQSTVNSSRRISALKYSVFAPRRATAPKQLSSS